MTVLFSMRYWCGNSSDTKKMRTKKPMMPRNMVNNFMISLLQARDDFVVIESLLKGRSYLKSLFFVKPGSLIFSSPIKWGVSATICAE